MPEVMMCDINYDVEDNVVVLPSKAPEFIIRFKRDSGGRKTVTMSSEGFSRLMAISVPVKRHGWFVYCCSFGHFTYALKAR